MPSWLQITPEPAPCCPRPRVWTCTVDRRNRSATSPNPDIAMSIRLPGPFADGDRGFRERASTHQRSFHYLLDKAGLEHALDVIGILNRLSVQGDQDVAEHQAGAVGRPVRL